MADSGTMYDVIIHALRKLSKEQPFLARPLLNMPLRAAQPEHYAFVNIAVYENRELLYQHKQVKQLTPDELKYTLAFLGMGVICNLYDRMGDRNHDLWTQAINHTINLKLRDLDVGTSPMPSFCDERFISMTSEEIYDILLAERNAGKTEEHIALEKSLTNAVRQELNTPGPNHMECNQNW